MESVVYVFVAIPERRTIYCKTVKNTADTEKEIDDMMDFLDGSRKSNFLWASYHSARVSFEQACADFGKSVERAIPIDNRTFV